MSAFGFKVLNQSNPPAATLSDLYVVPTGLRACATGLYICNTGSVPATFRVAVAMGGTPDAIQQYLYRDVNLSENDTFAAEVGLVGLTLSAGDVIRVYASNSNLSFSVFGWEIA